MATAHKARKLAAARKSVPASSTAKKLLKLLATKPIRTQAEAGRMLGVSRERVRQLVGVLGLELNQRRDAVKINVKCRSCAVEKLRSAAELRQLRYPDYCEWCSHQQRPRSPVGVPCRQCGRTRNYDKSVAKRRMGTLCRWCWEKGTGKSPKVSQTAVMVECSRCGRKKAYPAWHAKKLTSGMCRDCWENRAGGRRSVYRSEALVTCPDCGREGLYPKDKAMFRRSGLCRDCWQKARSKSRA